MSESINKQLGGREGDAARGAVKLHFFVRYVCFDRVVFAPLWEVWSKKGLQ